jgi:3-methyladenine DNA glycosylase/8-oxoguanine DNA glycosylase
MSPDESAGAGGEGGGARAGRSGATPGAAAGTTHGGAAGATPLEARFDAPGPLDLKLTMEPLGHGREDATIRFRSDGVWLARRTAAGPASMRIWTVPGEEAIMAQAWGPGAELALAAVPGLAGLLDDPGQLIAGQGLVRELQRRFPGLRFPRTGQLLPCLVPAVLGQKVTAGEAHSAYAALLEHLGEPAPGPVPLLLTPTGLALAALPYYDFHPMGLERRRAEVVKNIARLEATIEGFMVLPADQAYARLQQIPGVGPWTAAEGTRLAFGDPDAVSLGDAHLPDLVSWALAGEARADDVRMLELLAPYAGQRARVIRMLEVSRIKIPRFGPRFAPRRIERI